MNVEQVLQFVEQSLLIRQLSPVERLILHQTWLGQNYSEMAQSAAYSNAHIKEVASRLWQELSDVVGERVTKKNLHLLLRQHKLIHAENQQSIQPQNLAEDRVKEANSANIATEIALEFPSSPVSLNSSLYINRPPIEELSYRELTQPGCVIRIKAARKMGKSSLLLRILARAKALTYETVSLDFQEADNAIFDSLDKFLRWFCVNISRQLKIAPKLDDYWDEDMGSKVSCKIYFEAYLLEQISNPLVLALNEVNRVFEHPHIARDFLPMLRFWHEVARQDKIWQKLRLVVVHATEVYVPLNINQSPFNVGLSIAVPPFTPEQVRELAVRYGLDWQDGSETEKLMAMVNGHPYLINAALYHLRQGKMNLEELLAAAPTLSGIYSDHLRSHLALLENEPQLASALRQAISADGSVQMDAIAAYKLESMGLVELDGNRASLTCELYRLYFGSQLKQENKSNKHSETFPKESQKLPRSESLDSLTQLADRHYFNQYLESQWQGWVKESTSVSLIVCEVDYFKFFNEAFGYKAGDSYLQIIAKIIQDCSKQQAAVVARYGGIEFGVILPGTAAKNAVEMAETMRETVKARAIAHDRSRFDGFPANVLTISIGVASTTPNEKNSPAMLVSAALEALAQSKRRERNCVTLSPNLNGGIWN